jgi:hypothetical protein
MKTIIPAVALVAGLLFSSNSQAALVTIEGTFTYFTSWMYDPATPIGAFQSAYVNNTQLTLSNPLPPPVGSSDLGTYYVSNPVNFTTPTTRLDFIYDPDPIKAFASNSFEFISTPGGADVVAGQTFQLGTFRFTNGQWHPQADIGFRLTTSSQDLALNGQIFEGTIRLISNSDTTPPFDPADEADFFYIVERSDLGSVRVYDSFRQPPGNPGSVGEAAFTGFIGSLIPTGFEALNGATFTNPSVLSGPLQPVPEPATYALMLAGFGLMGLIALTRKKAG